MNTFLYFTLDYPIAKFIGFVYFLITALTGFWCLKYLIGMIPYWITYGAAENYGNLQKNIIQKNNIEHQIKLVFFC